MKDWTKNNHIQTTTLKYDGYDTPVDRPDSGRTNRAYKRTDIDENKHTLDKIHNRKDLYFVN